jgi:peptidoglycan hydrolase-like protein with peptidoglycan-binding domain
MIKRTLFTVGLSAMLAMPMLAVGQQTPMSPGMSSGMGSGASGSGTEMQHRGHQEMGTEQILMAQEQLKKAGFDPGPIDGQLGQKTAQAIREYQKSNGLPQTGRLDEPTKELLMVQRTEPSPSRMEPSPGFGPGSSSPGASMPGSRSPSSTSPGGDISTGGGGRTGSGR